MTSYFINSYCESCCYYVLNDYFIFVQLIQGGKGEAIRIRAILRSLIPIQDLQGVISISFQIPSVSKGWIGHIGQTLAAVAFF